MAAGGAEWDGVGMFGDPAAYERFMGRWSARLAPAFLEEVGLGDPAAVVDVGCGTGNLALSVAERWPSARVTGVEPSAAFVRAGVWDYSDGMSMLREMWDAVASVGLDAGHLDVRRMPLGHAGALASLLAMAGLEDGTDGVPGSGRSGDA